MNNQETTVIVNVIRELESLGGLLNGFEAAMVNVNGQLTLMLRRETLKEIGHKIKVCAQSLSGSLVAEQEELNAK